MIDCRFYVNGDEYAGRSLEAVPDIGHQVHFKGGDYVVKRVVWDLSSNPGGVATGKAPIALVVLERIVG